MFYDAGCYGGVRLGELPEGVQQRLAAVPGDWLEFDAPTGMIVVRHIQPSAGPCLPTITGELVRMLGEIPEASQGAIPGGEFFVHTESGGQLVRLKVELGGAVKIEWAHPDYTRARPQPYRGERLEIVEPRVQRLNGTVSFRTKDVARAVQELEGLADTYEGLYPEGDLVATPDMSRTGISVEVRDLNLDVLLLVERLQQLATKGSLSGHIDVSSFAAVFPEQHLRFVFKDGALLVQRPVLWTEPATAGAIS
ncbi:MAG: hypothetical protein ABSG61_05255 [Gemmatimonadales bacterium]|jgi:hypothetical protein